MKPHPHFGWLRQGRGSDACRDRGRTALRNGWPWLLLFFVVMLTVAGKAHAGGMVPAHLLPYLITAAVLMVFAGGVLAGMTFERAVAERRPHTTCRACESLEQAKKAAKADLARSTRRVRAGSTPPVTQIRVHASRALDGIPPPQARVPAPPRPSQPR